MVPKPPACQEVWRAASVFAGTVVQIEELKDEVKVTLAVTEPFTGLDPADKQSDIFTASGGPACGFPFERGRSYLVYTHKSDGALHTSHCMRTALLDDAAEDLAYLRSLSTRKTVGQLTGVVHDSRARTDLADVPLTIHSDSFQKTASTNAAGRFAFSDLAPGNYTVSAAASGYFAGKPITVQVPAKGCADVQFDLNVDRGIVGTLSDQFGQAVPNVTVETTGAQIGYRQAKSDSQGHYEFRALPAGEYFLGVTLTSQPLPDHPYESWYYPGVHDPSKAVSLLIGQAPKVLTVDLSLPEAQKQVIVEGFVQWPDGRPAAGIDVFPEDPDFPKQLGMIRFTADENGKFQAKLYDKTTYKLYSVKWESSPQKATSAEPVTVIPGQLEKGSIIRLVLSHDGDLLTPEMNKH